MAWPPPSLGEALDSDEAPAPEPSPITYLPLYADNKKAEARNQAPGYVWTPLRGSQALAIACPAQEILTHGTRAGGKTESQLMYFRAYVGRGYGSYWSGVIFDQKYKNLDDLVSKSRRCLGSFCDGARFYESAKDFKWVWPSGEELKFRAASKLSDYDNYHGHDIPYLGHNELTKHATSDLYDAFMSCNRSGFKPEEHSPIGKDGRRQLLPEMPLTVFSTTNPWGPGHAWVKQRFIDAAPPGVILRVPREIFNPRTRQKETVYVTQTHLYSSWRDNHFLSPKYIATLTSITDPIKRKAWLDGDWDIAVGGAFGDLWDRDRHIVPRFRIPASWTIFRSLDWGTSRPFSVGFWAVANGEEVRLPNGQVFCPPAGSIIRFAEWYGAEDLTKNVGLNLGPSSVARGILEREESLLENGWIKEPVDPGPADNSIDTAQDNESISVKTRMEEAGVTWKESNKKPGSRKNGVALFREALTAARTMDGPAVYFMQNCAAAIALLPTVPRDEDDPDDVDTDSIDHVWDETRYALLFVPSTGVRNMRIAFPT